MPLMHAWMKRTLQWWNKVVARLDHDLVRCALADSVQVALHPTGAKNVVAVWAAQFKSSLSGLSAGF